MMVAFNRLSLVLSFMVGDLSVPTASDISSKILIGEKERCVKSGLNNKTMLIFFCRDKYGKGKLQ